MPTVPKPTQCQMLGCKEHRAKYGAYCLQHGGTNAYPSKRWNITNGRKEAIAMYKSRHWQSMRAAQLSAHPLCVGCLSGGIVSQATQVDHLFPWQQIGDHAFFRNIFQSLCASCHASKTGMEKHDQCRRYGAPTEVFRVADYERVMRERFDAPSAAGEVPE
jgi:5-methylcytosine-specific restriction protein A